MVDQKAQNVPSALSRFVGREREQADVEKLLGESRLVTLVGMPGVGKTRLALQVAASMAPFVPGGASYAELAPLADPALVPQVVASALDVRERPGVDLVDSLVTHLRHKRLLLVLDNCEHLVESCAGLVLRLLGECSDLTVLATSREPLGLNGEQLRRVEPLPVPEGRELDGAPELFDSVRLFVERAAATPAGFKLTPDVAPVVAEICRRLDGIPLAIELAAARLEVLSPAEVLEQLDERFRLLRSSGRAVPVWHTSLLGALDWSHQLLSAPKATLLRRLSVFGGGCTLDAVEAVCAADGVDRDDVLELLGGLVRKSLVSVDTGGGRARFRLLDTIREYARRRLEDAGEVAAVSARHCTWFAQLAEQAEAELAAGRQGGWLERLDAEQDNLRVAFEWALGGGRPDTALRMGAALVLYWWLQGHVREGSELLRRALSAGRDEPEAVRATATWAAGFLAGSAGNVAEAASLAEESLAMSHDCGDPSTRGRARNLLGLLAMYRSPAEALPLLEQNLRLAREADDPRLLITALNTVATALMLVGDARAARPHLDECIEVSRRAENRPQAAAALCALGQAALALGELPRAESLLDDALAMATEIGERGEVGVVLSWLGELARERGDHDLARSHLDAGLALAREMGRPFLVARCLCFLGRLALAENDVVAGRSAFTESLSMARRLGLSFLSARCLVGLGRVSHAEGDREAARAWLDEALVLAEDKGDRQAVASATSGLAASRARRGTRRAGAGPVPSGAGAAGRVGRSLRRGDLAGDGGGPLGCDARRRPAVRRRSGAS